MTAKYSVMVLIAALAVGLGIGFAASMLAYRHKVLTVPNANLLDRMNTKLDLTAVQREEISEIIEDTRDRMTQLRHNFQRQRRRNFLAAYLRMRAVLTPAQQANFDQEFIPPRFRDEAAQLEQSPGGPLVPSTPGANPTPSNTNPSPAGS